MILVKSDFSSFILLPLGRISLGYGQKPFQMQCGDEARYSFPQGSVTLIPEADISFMCNLNHC